MLPNTKDIKENYIVSSLVRGFKILSSFTVKRPTLKVSELAEMTGLDQATVFRFVYTLEKMGYLVRDDETKRYKQGVRMLALSLPAREGVAARAAGIPMMTELSRQINENVRLGVLDGVEVVTVAVLEVLEKLIYPTVIGQRSPAFCTAQGKVLLAYQPVETWDELISQIEFMPRTEQTIVDPDAFRKELQKTRRQGYATQDNEFIVGLGAIAAPVFEVHGDVAAAVSISGLSTQILHDEKFETFVTELQKCARRISNELGYFPEIMGIA
jgi:DNA-binding IclR family transcriptional regulator